MPFITHNERVDLDLNNIPPSTVGQMCYVEYKKLVSYWYIDPRWTTIHNLAKSTFDITDAQAARLLAYLVFFSMKAMPYEIEKEKTNGTI
jgi:hypothetical protein